MYSLSNNQISPAVLASLYFLLAVTVVSCAEPARTVKPYVSESYSFQDIHNIVIYSDFSLRRNSYGEYMHRELEKEFADHGISVYSQIEHTKMRENVAFSEAESRNIHRVLILKDIREEYPKCRISLYETNLKTLLLRSVIQVSGNNWVSPHETHSRLVKAIMRELEMTH